ncbi:hypothetical protein GBAR_LOCUS2634 [Geodia barretti]|uniref:Uncharacterized protein n=1 Tax=Geodia barretti TaxID=519541 RepID=A0AA35R0B0_GEOBA|nr:hypothetical protein GBAR_LOCUS2634 [Geodia barretti]
MSVEKSKILLSLSILARIQSKASTKGVSVCGLCVESKSPDRVEVLSLEYDDGINVDLDDLTRHAIASSASLGDGDIYCTYAKKNEAGIEAEIKELKLKYSPSKMEMYLKNG